MYSRRNPEPAILLRACVFRGCIRTVLVGVRYEAAEDAHQGDTWRLRFGSTGVSGPCMHPGVLRNVPDLANEPVIQSIALQMGVFITTVLETFNNPPPVV